MYGGSGILPNLSSISINIPSYINLKWRIPSSSIFTHLAFSKPEPNDTIVPNLILLAGFAKQTQVSSQISFKSKTSILALVSIFSPINLAGITLVSFKTKASPGFK